MSDEKLFNELSKINNELIDAKRELSRINRQLEDSLKINGELQRELQHRVKNSFNMISSMIGLAVISTGSEEAHIVLADLDSRIRSVSDLYSLLYESGSFSKVRLDEYCLKIGRSLVGISASVTLEANLQPVVATPEQATPVGMLVTELMTNCLKYAFPDGRPGTIKISLTQSGAAVSLRISDDGIGLPDGFDADKSDGMGLSLAKSLSAQIGGRFSIRGTSAGTLSTVEFGLEPPAR